MRLTVLGSGTAVPNADRFPAGYAVTHRGGTLLVDLGPGTLRRLPAAGIDLGTVRSVLFTHYHTDHCADVAALLFALRNPRFAGRDPLVLHGAPGLVRLVGKLTEAWPWLEPRGYELRLVELAPGRHTIDVLTVEAIPIRHTAQSLGYRVGDGAGTIAFSGDADECDELVDLARDADLFVCDTASPDDQKLDGHLTPGLAAAYAARARTKTLVMTHFYPECDGVDLVAEARRRFAGGIVAAEDLMTLDP
jgi:ribonuclease BN (tRNA processing enzyme)